MTDKDQIAQPWGHIHAAIDHLTRPAQDLEKSEGLGWGYDEEKTRPEVNGKATKRLDQEELETLTYLSDGERETTSIEKVLATMAGDLVGLGYRADFMRSSIGVKGKGAERILKAVGGATPKISVPTTLGKVRRIVSNDKGEEKREEEWSQASG